MNWNDVQHRTATWQATVDETGWPLRLGLSIGMAGILSLMALVSFPLPWTPVPFTMTPFALLVVGGYQRPGWAALSVLLYLAAGALGAPIFAQGNSGPEHLIGNTAGYLVGYVAVAALVSWYMQERRRVLPGRWLTIIAGFVGLTVLAGIAAIIRFTGTGAGFDAYGEDYASWGQPSSLLWVFAFLSVAAMGLVAWALLRYKRQGVQALNLYLLFMAATGLLHLCGVIGLVTIAGLDLLSAVIVGSVVFLPFDIIKAGLGVAATLPWLPAPPEPTDSMHPEPLHD